MNIIIALLGKIFAADGAFIGRLPCVDPDVVVQIVLSEECLATEQTLVLLVTRVLPHV